MSIRVWAMVGIAMWHFNKAIWPIPGSLIALVLLYAHGARRERRTDDASS